MAASMNLNSIGLIEKDRHGDILWTWSYPSVTDKQRQLYIQKSGLENGDRRDQVSFLYSRLNNHWYYIAVCKVSNTDNLPELQELALVLTSLDFNPEKYRALCQLLCQAYRRSGQPVTMLEVFLGVITKCMSTPPDHDRPFSQGVCQSQTNGSFSVREYSNVEAYSTGLIKDVINNLGMESILVFTALLLKKRVVVFHPRVDELLNMIRCFPAFVWHRQNWEILYPYLLLKDANTALKHLSHYVAGFTEAAVENRSDLYDVFVNLQTNDVIVPSHAKEDFILGKIHKDIASTMVQSAQVAENSEKQVIKDIATKTSELLNTLRTFSNTDGEKPQISLEALRERKIPQNTEKFLFNLAAAEGWVQL